MTPVNHARDDSTANSDTLDAVCSDDNRFRIGGDLYTYDSNDRFINAGKVVDIAKSKELFGVGLTAGTGQTKTEATVQVVLYDGQASSRWKPPPPSRKPTHPPNTGGRPSSGASNPFKPRVEVGSLRPRRSARTPAPPP